MMNKGMIYTLNRAEAENEVNKIRATLTSEQLTAHNNINDIVDGDGKTAAAFCIMDRISQIDFGAYSMEFYKAVEAACYDAYMMGKQAAQNISDQTE